MNIQEQINLLPGEEIELLTDKWHSFKELYEFRKVYNAALFNEWATENKHSKQQRLAVQEEGFDVGGFIPKHQVHKSWKHHDGELCFGGGWFIVVAVLPTGQISNHYEAKDWDLFNVSEAEKALFPFDGHSSFDVLERLKQL